MTRTDAIKWLSNLKMDIGKTQHQELWHYEQALDEIIKELPPKDIPKEPKTGKWIVDRYCSECEWDKQEASYTSGWRENYCPNCGAYMRGDGK